MVWFSHILLPLTLYPLASYGERKYWMLYEVFQLMWQWYMHSKTIALIVRNFALFKDHPIANFIWSHMFYNPIICFILLSRPRWEKQLWYIIMFHFSLCSDQNIEKRVFLPLKKKKVWHFYCIKPMFSRWWVLVGSNHRPCAYQAHALTSWAKDPIA